MAPRRQPRHGKGSRLRGRPPEHAAPAAPARLPRGVTRQAAAGHAITRAMASAASPWPALPLLRLIWLASPALPVGGFSYSEGLEAAVEAGAVVGEAGALRWLREQLALVQQRGEWPLVASAAAAWRRGDGPRVRALNDWAVATRESAELRQQSLQMGRSLAEWLQQRWPAEARTAALVALQPGPTWPMACALAAVLSGAPLREALLALGFGWCEQMVQAAIKAVPLGQAGGQRLLQALVEALPAAVDAALARAAEGDAARLQFAPMLAIRSSQHEAQYSRLFRS